MKNLYLLTLLTAALGVVAQPTINSSVLPTVGHFDRTFPVNHTLIDIETTGANVTWDFSNATSTGETTTNTFVSPTGMQGASNFSNATMAFQAATQSGNNSVSYFRTDESGYGLLGSYVYNQTDVLAVSVLSTPLFYIRAPFTFNSEYNGQINGVTYTSGFEIDRSGTQSMICDGYGTLKTSVGTYNDILRLKINYEYEDEFMGSVSGEYETDFIAWVSASTGKIIVSYTKNNINSNISYAAVVGDYPTSIDELFSMDEMTIFPQPASLFTNIRFKTNKTERVSIELFDLQGRQVGEKEQINLMSGEQIHQLDLSSMVKGMYLLKVSNGLKVSSRVISVQ